MSLVFDTMASTTTADDSSLTERAASHLRWQLIFDGVWLARREGRFAGMVQGVVGDSMKLTDAHGNLCGLYASLDDAKSALAERSN
jgi:hypothetical protein